MNLKFNKKGVCIVKISESTSAKITDRKIFFAGINNPKFTLFNPKYPYSIQINGMIKEVETLVDVEREVTKGTSEVINKIM